MGKKTNGQFGDQESYQFKKNITNFTSFFPEKTQFCLCITEINPAVYLLGLFTRINTERKDPQMQENLFTDLRTAPILHCCSDLECQLTSNTTKEIFIMADFFLSAQCEPEKDSQLSHNSFCNTSLSSCPDER